MIFFELRRAAVWWLDQETWRTSDKIEKSYDVGGFTYPQWQRRCSGELETDALVRLCTNVIEHSLYLR
jgi:hypothetical protein